MQRPVCCVYIIVSLCFSEVYNFDLEGIITPVNPDILEQLLVTSNYDSQEMNFLVNGFRHGFDIGYKGPHNRKDMADNIPLQVGSKEELWSKIMKEVKAKRFAGPFRKPPFKNFVQSPIGLVPKSGGKTRLIFHLSYDFPETDENGNEHKCINFYTPKELCSVTYRGIDYAVLSSFKWERPGACFYSKTDVQSAFRVLPLSPKCIHLLLMKAVNPS